MHQVGKEGGSRRSASSSQSFMESLVKSRSEWSGSCRQWGANWLWSHGYCFMADRSVSVGLRVRPLRASLTEGGSEQYKYNTQEIRMLIGSRGYKKSGFKY